MRIALIGNMNNNNFSLLRHFHDLGYHSDLYLFSDEGVGESEHFHWENDTWDTEKWRKFIFKTPLCNSHIQVFSNNIILYLFFYFLFKIFSNFNLPGKLWLNPGKFRPSNYLVKTFRNYDIIIGSGCLPALFSLKNKIELDVFYPYSLGIEYLMSPASTENLYKNSSFSLIIKLIIKYVRQKQLQGLKRVNTLIISDMNETKKVLEINDINFYSLPVPLFYPYKKLRKSDQMPIIKIIEKISQFNFTILMTSRHFWVPPNKSDKSWINNQSKNNDFLFKAFLQFKKRFPKSEAKIFLLEYGKDVNESKRFILKNKLQNDIIWINKLPRKHLISILKLVNVSVGEFYKSHGVIWGGTAIEALSCGTPFINGNNFDQFEFENNFGFEEPPFLYANSVNEIENHLIQLYTDKNFANKISNLSLRWFELNHGKNLANKWIKLINKDSIPKISSKNQ